MTGSKGAVLRENNFGFILIDGFSQKGAEKLYAMMNSEKNLF